MCKEGFVEVVCESVIHIAKTSKDLESLLDGIQRREEVFLGKKVLPVYIANEKKARVLKMFVSANRISGWEMNGERKEPYYVKGIDGVVDVFKLSLA